MKFSWRFFRNCSFNLFVIFILLTYAIEIYCQIQMGHIFVAALLFMNETLSWDFDIWVAGCFFCFLMFQFTQDKATVDETAKPSEEEINPFLIFPSPEENFKVPNCYAAPFCYMSSFSYFHFIQVLPFDVIRHMRLTGIIRMINTCSSFHRLLPSYVWHEYNVNLATGIFSNFTYFLGIFT